MAKLEEWANTNANDILDSWKTLTNYLIGKYTNGWVIHFEGATKDGAVMAPGYRCVQGGACHCLPYSQQTLSRPT